MNVPLLDLKAHHQPLRKELLAALEQVLDKNNFILGNEVAELESHGPFVKQFFRWLGKPILKSSLKSCETRPALKERQRHVMLVVRVCVCKQWQF